MESLIKLTVKTPNQRIEDIEIDCDLKWTVRKLKEYLQDVYPSNPSSNSQKLIYLGKLLQDHLLLKEVFGDWGSQTLHIVCGENATQQTDNPTTDKCASVSTPSTSSNAIPTLMSGSSSTTDGLRHRPHVSTVMGNPEHPVSPSLAFTQASYSNFYNTPMMSSYSSTPNLSHMAVHQQQQYQQQMQQYYQHLQQWHALMASQSYHAAQMSPTNSYPSQPGSPFSHFPRPHSADDLNQRPPAENQQPAQQRPPPAEEENAPMNAGPGEIQDEFDDGRNRDWLDWVYMSLRGMVLFSFVYFYSSTSRFLMVSLLGFLIYLYKAGWFTPQRVQIREVHFDQRDNAPAAGAAPQRENVNENGGANNENDTSNNNDANINTQPEQVNVFSIFWTFCKAFFGSLIPTPPPRPLQP